MALEQQEDEMIVGINSQSWVEFIESELLQ